MSNSYLGENLERRRNRRYAVRCNCWLERDDETIFGTTADIGLGGLFLRTAIPIEPGRRVDVQLDLKGSEGPVVARGLVARAILARAATRYGVGVEFTSIESGKETLTSFLTSRATPVNLSAAR